MNKIVINGGRPLSGSVNVSGSKNAALPILFACLIVDGCSQIDGLPNIGDVRVALDILRGFGAKIELNQGRAYVDCTGVSYNEPDPRLISGIRASTYLIGACLARFGRCRIASYGGCNFSLRPIDLHLLACRSLGAEIDGDLINANGLCGGVIKFSKPSVGATVNALLLASRADGETVIEGGAEEPHIDSLIDFLVSCGAEISRRDNRIFIKGADLHGGKIRIIGDMIEAGSYLAAGIITDGCVQALGCPCSDMGAVFSSFRSLGAECLTSADRATVRLLGGSSYTEICALPFPEFPTDLQPIFAPMMAALRGGKITDLVWQERFGYLRSLADFGVISECYRNTAYIYPSRIHSATSSAPDLRGGMACILAALSAEGRSEIYSADTVLRGYENIVDKLCALGADVKIENT